MNGTELTRTPTVEFHDPDEFLDELRRDKELVERKILRVTIRRRYGTPFVAVGVVATAVVGDSIIRLNHHVGEALVGDRNLDILARAERVIAKLTAAALVMGLEVRAGIVE